MVNIPGNKVKNAHKIELQVKNFWQKVFFEIMIMDVYFQNMAIKNCDYPRQAVIKPQKLIIV